MAAAPTSTFSNSVSNPPPRTVHALVNEDLRAPPPVRLYPSQHRVSMTRYATSTDPRGYIPVFEYPLNGQYIMIDCETGMVHFTGIWKALGHTKADVVKLVESDPTIAPYLRKVRGGYLKIQGTWLPFETAQTLARRVAWQIRYDLIPLFGPGFPDTCLGPGEPGFGQLLLSAPKPRGRRGAKKSSASSTPTSRPADSPAQEERHPHPGVHQTYNEAPRMRNTPRNDAIGPMASCYSSSASHSRYSPYGRAPSHGITQLEPLPNLLPPNQARPHQADPLFNYHQTVRSASSFADTTASRFDGCNIDGSPALDNPSASLPGTASLPSMRNSQPSPSHNNFFETYRGPDSFEALSNRWLASDTATTGAMPAHSMSRMQYATGTVHRPGYSYSTADVQTVSDQVDATERATGFGYEQQYRADYGRPLVNGGLDRQQLLSSSGYSPPQETYANHLARASQPTDARDPEQICPKGYIEPSAASNGTATGSPNSQSSHDAAKSPSSSSASTSTHLQQNYHRHQSHRSSQITLGGLSTQNGCPQQSDDLNQFSVLTSPTQLDLRSGSNAPPELRDTESEWSRLQNTAAISPSHNLHA